MSEIIRNRSELLFCYDVTDANPNGDPLDENKPRIDEETNVNFVTDVRLKRTIRDYLFEYKGFNGENRKDIFVHSKFIKDGDKESGLQDGKLRAKDFEENKDEILDVCIDIRLFGGVLPLSGDSITFTGPTQFKMGRSLHKVEIKHIQGTGAFAGKAGAKQNTFREEYILPYSFIAFHGIVNQNAAKHTKMKDEDLNLLLEGMWHGTKNLISRSKFGQQPRLLIKINYNKPNFFIGDLDKKIKLIDFDNELKIRSIKDFSVDLSELLAAIKENIKHIESVEYIADNGLKIYIPAEWKKLNL
ncbi:MAG: type I-B CRISPR-associated protein Cas7/Csh2 [Candidatus Cloacimonetes bacterium]|nr:type I-B CRISPR-associated protein Cas7/Csh2 [Candidatus Cloacimonadota bacterium]MCF7815175.1 type I-B CRISPR-associated protein Cas7/Csh2 [Candidatus Cloacimonadota bacterium]MCF7867697.1 type I-B CRISPR-associated protein Cas7/Csh2 [Candidatus Cloacimonadota bacterium]